MGVHEHKTLELAAHGWLHRKIDHAQLESMLNELGRDGWELVNAFDTNWGRGATQDMIAIFKRKR
jgi:hypothetical protein